jgi:prepilin-type N-terminal cleavage/methylation domain-containing protein
MKRRLRNRGGFSLIEIIAAIVILAVVATATVATITPMREKSRNKIDQQNIARLNGIVQAYYMEYGAYPDRNLTVLNTRGYTTTRTQPTPYGGVYQWDNARLSIVNPQAPAPLP